MASLKDLVRADAAADAAIEQLVQATKDALPVGSVLTLRFYNYSIEAVVVRHTGYRDQIDVVNLRTLKRRRIDAAYMLRTGCLALEHRGSGISVYADEGND